MECEPEELQFLGPVGIYRESVAILRAHRPLYARIAAAFVLPLSALFLAHIAISHALFSTIDSDDSALESSAPGTASQQRILQRLGADWAALVLFKAAYLLALLLFSLLSPAATVFSVAKKNVVWHLASVVSVLEDYKGFQAMRKSKALIQGKLWTVVIIFVTLNIVFVVVEFAFRAWIVQGARHGLGAGGRLLLGLVILAALCSVVMVALVVQTVVYLVCKSYHHESIDKSNISDHLEVYLGDYVPLKASDVQMQHFGDELLHCGLSNALLRRGAAQLRLMPHYGRRHLIPPPLLPGHGLEVLLKDELIQQGEDLL
ncbi:hypothetical protein TRIUR3_32538 [Triticum urartu]|uniref:Uncharacterized protein n=1 Tax=Triticum urartu TaxID=4572 RepID=M7ZLG6_TRIUA|nr:hypothetical protein TRIUR3_32538 [Triticum urartu]